MKNQKTQLQKETEKLINKIASLLKGKTVEDSTNILFKAIDKIKKTTIVC